MMTMNNVVPKLGRLRLSPYLACIAGLIVGAVGCSGTSDNPSSQSSLGGGSSAGSTSPASGGLANDTHVPGSGGTAASSDGTGGATSTSSPSEGGSASATTASGGNATTGGKSGTSSSSVGAGGAVTSGGAQAAGGSLPSTSAATGGKSQTGGAGAGGSMAKGGATSSGGTSATGSTAKGGATSTGGTSATGTGSPGNYPLGNPPVKSAGCGKTPTLTSGTKTIQSNGKSRSYIIRIPDNYDNTKPYKLVFANHWMGGNKEDVDTGRTVTTNVWSYYGLKALDTAKTTIFVAPDGNQCGTWCKDDEKFIDDMYNLFRGDLCIDESRVFATGFSFGAIFTYSLACDRPNIFRAVAALAAASNIGCSSGSTPVAYFAEVGMSDPLCTPALGRTCRDTFVSRNGCTKPASIPEWSSADGKTHVCYSYEGCKAGYPVRWCTGNYAHIAAPNDATTGDNGNTTWAKEESWKFFSQF